MPVDSDEICKERHVCSNPIALMMAIESSAVLLEASSYLKLRGSGDTHGDAMILPQ